jgi:uncharacterized HAD superfamily protein
VKYLIDLDGVVTDFFAGFLSEATRVLQRPVTLVDPTQWDLALSCQLTKEEEKKVWHAISQSKTFWFELPPHPTLTGDVLVQNIAPLTIYEEVYFVTARTQGLRIKHQTERWLEAHGVNRPTVVLASEKLPLIQTVRIDRVIEDNPFLLWELRKYPHIQTTLCERPYNTHIAWEGLRRVTSLTEVFQRKAGHATI